MAGNLSGSESAETALVFVSKVVKKVGSAEEISELSSLARKCPSILPRAMSVMDRVMCRLTRSQIKNDKLENELKEVVKQKDEQVKEMEERYESAAVEIKDLNKAGDKIPTIVALERQVGEKIPVIATFERQLAEAKRRAMEAETEKSEQRRVNDRRIGCAKIRISDLERNLSEKKGTIASLERQLAEVKRDADDAKDLRHELVRTQELLSSYHKHSKKMRLLFGQHGSVRANSPVCPREVEEKLVELATDNPAAHLADGNVLVKERWVMVVDREATTEEESD